MSIESNKAVVRAYAEAFSRGDLKAVCGCFDENAVIYGVLGSGRLDVARPIWSELMSGLKMQLTIEAMVAEKDMVAVRFRERGTFAGKFRGIEPTGKSYEITAMEWFEFRDGKIVQRWGARDSATIARQVGMTV